MTSRWGDTRKVTDGDFVVGTAKHDGEIQRRCRVEQYEKQTQRSATR